MDVEAIIDRLGLTPLGVEGGYYRETYHSEEMIPLCSLPSRYKGVRCFSTAIYYLLTPETFSAFHRFRSDEVFHFYLGDPVTMVRLFPDGHGKTTVLGSDIMSGQCLQVVVAKNVWQGAYLNAGGRFALMGTTVAPGFDFEDFEVGDRGILLEKYSGHESFIKRLTHESL